MEKTLLLLIHGLGGESKKTWGKFPQLIEDDSQLGSKLDVEFYSYPTAILRVPFLSPAPKIQTLADGLASQIKHTHKNYQQVIIVAHSLGGLVARQYLVNMAMQSQSHPVIGLMLYAVPNDGAGLASIAKTINWWHPQHRQLCKDSDFIDTLNNTWTHQSLNKTIPCKYIIAGTDAIVSKTSAQAFWGNTAVETVVDKGHIDLVKPDQPDDLAFTILKNFVCDEVSKPVPALIPEQSTAISPVNESLSELTTKTDIPNNLPHPNRYFSGREAQLHRLHQSLQDKTLAAVTQPVAVYGLGGVGKTQLAIQYAWQYQSDYSAVLWVDAETELGWETGLEGLAELLGITPAQSDQRLQAVREWLHRHHRWLLIVDNIDSETQQQRVLKDSEQFHNGYWLFTSRLSQWSPQVAQLDLDYFNQQEAHDFLNTRLKQSINPDNANRLSQQLGCLPLALEQAAAYILMRGMTVNEYLALLEQQPETLLKTPPHNYPHSVWETWNLSHDALDEDAKSLMVLMCSFASEPLPRELITKQAQVIVETLWNEQANAFQRVDQALAQLIGYSLVRIDQGMLIIHRLLHQVTGLQADPALLTNAQTLAQNCLASTIRELNPQDVRDWLQLERLISHIEYTTAELETDWTSLLLNQLGGLFLYKAQYQYAEPLLRRALSIDEAGFGSEHPNVARDLNNLAQLLKATNRLDEAEPLMRRALSIDEASFGAEHPDVAIELNNLAQLLQATNQLDEAEPLMRRALSIDEASFGAEHSDVANDLNNLAQLLKATNRLDEAELLMRRALSIDEASFGSEHPRVAAELNNLAQLLQATNRLDEAEPLMRRALSIDEASFGAEHPDVARDLINLARLLQETNRLDEAEPLVRRALSIDEASFGAEHPNVGRDLNNLAQLLQDTKSLFKIY